MVGEGETRWIAGRVARANCPCCDRGILLEWHDRGEFNLLGSGEYGNVLEKKGNWLGLLVEMRNRWI
jgi:hypothetical protein